MQDFTKILKEKNYEEEIIEIALSLFLDAYISYDKLFKYIKIDVGNIKNLIMKHNLVENKDYLYKKKSVLFITPEIVKMICLIYPNEENQKFRGTIIQIENEFKKYISEITKINNKYIYLINIKDDIYKYGITNDINSILHQINDKQSKLIKYYDCRNNEKSIKIFNKITNYTIEQKITDKYQNEQNIIKMNDPKILINVIQIYLDHENDIDKLELKKQILHEKNKMKKNDEKKATQLKKEEESYWYNIYGLIIYIIIIIMYICVQFRRYYK